MTKKVHILIVICFCTMGLSLKAQFREKAFSQSYADSTTKGQKDTVESLFSVKEYFRGLAHKETPTVGTMLAGSTVLIGGMQIYNRQYWKLPLIYTSFAACLGTGIALQKKHPKISAGFYAGAAAIYWASLMDGVINYPKNPIQPHSPGKATLYALLFPGLGQIYNKEYWKLPIYWGGLIASAHFWQLNHSNFKRFRDIYIRANEKGYNGPIPAETALYYRNQYRRLRDYATLSFVLVYILQVIDANVFAYMLDFEVSPQLSLKLEPTILMPEQQFAFSPDMGTSALGLKMGFRF